jgi:hypothetical protein
MQLNEVLILSHPSCFLWRQLREKFYSPLTANNLNFSYPFSIFNYPIGKISSYGVFPGSDITYQKAVTSYELTAFSETKK